MKLSEAFPNKTDAAKGIRGAYGERAFDDAGWLCHCGGPLDKNDETVKYNPDRRCPCCGQLVDIKTSTSGDSVSISQVPFDKYPPDLIIAVLDHGRWIGSRRSWCVIKSGPHEPAQKGNRPTKYYWVYLSSFLSLERLLTAKR